MEKEGETGTAYAFFQCDAPITTIVRTLPDIREAARTPSTLELSVATGILEGDKAIKDLGREAKDAGMNYVITARDTEATNKSTADRLADVMNQAYQSNLYETGAPFHGEIVYQTQGKYVFRE